MYFLFRDLVTFGDITKDPLPFVFAELQNAEYILSISTNAGGNFSIVFGSDYFLNEVHDILIEIIANPEKENDAVINISSQKIEVKKVEFKDYATLQNFEGAHS